MTEDEKRKFDALESLRDHAWREFKHKSRAEWRLSFGIWAALLASMSVLIASNKPLVGNLMEDWLCELKLLAVAIPIGHIYFLHWIQIKLGEARDILNEAQNGMGEMLGAGSLTTKLHNKLTKPRSNWKQPPLWIESGITILLVVMLYVVFKYSEC